MQGYFKRFMKSGNKRWTHGEGLSLEVKTLDSVSNAHAGTRLQLLTPASYSHRTGEAVGMAHVAGSHCWLLPPMQGTWLEFSEPGTAKLGPGHRWHSGG